MAVAIFNLQLQPGVVENAEEKIFGHEAFEFVDQILLYYSSTFTYTKSQLSPCAPFDLNNPQQKKMYRTLQERWSRCVVRSSFVDKDWGTIVTLLIRDEDANTHLMIFNIRRADKK